MAGARNGLHLFIEWLQVFSIPLRRDYFFFSLPHPDQEMSDPSEHKDEMSNHLEDVSHVYDPEDEKSFTWQSIAAIAVSNSVQYYGPRSDVF